MSKRIIFLFYYTSQFIFILINNNRLLSVRLILLSLTKHSRHNTTSDIATNLYKASLILMILDPSSEILCFDVFRPCTAPRQFRFIFGGPSYYYYYYY